MFLFKKHLCGIFKDCRNPFDERFNKNKSQINELFEQDFLKIIHKSKNGACYDENNMDWEVEATFCSKVKERNNVF